MIVLFEKTPAKPWGEFNKNWNFWWFGFAFGQMFIGIMVRTRIIEQEDE